MTTEHQCVGILHSHLHSMSHFSRLSFKESSAATNKNCVTRENTLCHILSLLISAKLNCVVFGSFVLHLTQVQNVASCMAWRMQTSYLYIADLQHLFILDW